MGLSDLLYSAHRLGRLGLAGKPSTSQRTGLERKHWAMTQPRDNALGHLAGWTSGLGLKHPWAFNGLLLGF